MTSRTTLVLAGLVLLVAGLAVLREARRPGPVPAPAPPAPAAAALPRVLDFGRDT